MNPFFIYFDSTKDNERLTFKLQLDRQYTYTQTNHPKTVNIQGTITIINIMNADILLYMEVGDQKFISLSSDGFGRKVCAGFNNFGCWLEVSCEISLGSILGAGPRFSTDSAKEPTRNKKNINK